MGPVLEKSGSRRPPLIWIVLAGALVLLAWFLTASLYDERQSIERQDVGRLTTLVRTLTDFIDLRLNHLNKILEHIRDDAPDGDWSEASLRPILDRYSNILIGVESYDVFDPSGRLVASTGPRLAAPGLKTPRAVEQPDPVLMYLSQPFTMPDGSSHVQFSRMMEKDGAVTGIVTANLSTAYFLPLLDSSRYMPDVQLLVTHEEGRIFATIPSLPELADRDLTQVKIFRNQLSQSGVTVATGRFIETGGDRLVVQDTARLPVGRLDRTFVLSASRDWATMLATWNRRVGTYVVLFVIISAGSIGAVAFFRYRRRQMEKLERESAERVNQVREAAGAGVWEFDVDTGSVRWGESMATLYGLPADQFPTNREPWEFMVVEEDRPKVLAVVTQAIAAGSSYTQNYRIRRPDGSLRLLRSFAQPFFVGGRVKSYSGLSIDVSTIAENEARLEELNYALKLRTKEAEQASEMKSQFLATVSHEIRTPMNAILNLLHLLGSTDLDRRQREYVRISDSSARTLLALLNDILDFSKAAAGKIQLESVPFSLEEQMRNLCAMLATLGKDKDLDMRVEVDPEVPATLLGDPLRLNQVLSNLASNAVKFTDKGEVVVAVKRLAVLGSTVLQFEVCDTGIGIAAERVDSLFQGFVQADASTARRYGGTGLGLAISRDLIRLMGGELAVESVPGVGSTFRFTAVFPEEPVPQRTLSPARSVLAAVRSPTQRQRLAELFASWNWRVAAQAPDDPVPTETFDIVVLDTGRDPCPVPELARVLRSRGTPVVLVDQARTFETPEAEAVSGAVDAYVLRPFTPALLRETLESVLEPVSVPLVTRERLLEGISLLVVEDNQTNRWVAKEVLEGAGATVDVAAGADESIDRLGKRSYDAVLMDVQMPEVDGYEATRRIRRLFGRALPIVAMTANVLEGERERCLEAGMDDHLEKPLDLPLLSRVLHRLLATQEFAFDQAVSRLNGRKDIFAKVSAAFLASLPETLAQLHTQVETQDLKEAARTLHILRGQAGTVGATGLAQESTVLEQRYQRAEAAALAELDRLAALSAEALRTHLTSEPTQESL